MYSLWEQGVVHAEVYIYWGNIMHYKPHLAIEAVMEAVEEARIQVSYEIGGPSIFWIVDAIRGWGARETAEVFRLAEQLKERFSTVVEVGIGGSETSWPIEHFARAYKEAKAKD